MLALAAVAWTSSVRGEVAVGADQRGLELVERRDDGGLLLLPGGLEVLEGEAPAPCQRAAIADDLVVEAAGEAVEVRLGGGDPAGRLGRVPVRLRLVSLGAVLICRSFLSGGNEPPRV